MKKLVSIIVIIFILPLIVFISNVEAMTGSNESSDLSVKYNITKVTTNTNVTTGGVTYPVQIVIEGWAYYTGATGASSCLGDGGNNATIKLLFASSESFSSTSNVVYQASISYSGSYSSCNDSRQNTFTATFNFTDDTNFNNEYKLYMYLNVRNVDYTVDGTGYIILNGTTISESAGTPLEVSAYYGVYTNNPNTESSITLDVSGTKVSSVTLDGFGGSYVGYTESGYEGYISTDATLSGDSQYNTAVDTAETTWHNTVLNKKNSDGIYVYISKLYNYNKLTSSLDGYSPVPEKLSSSIDSEYWVKYKDNGGNTNSADNYLKTEVGFTGVSFAYLGTDDYDIYISGSSNDKSSAKIIGTKDVYSYSAYLSNVSCTNTSGSNWDTAETYAKNKTLSACSLSSGDVDEAYESDCTMAYVYYYRYLWEGLSVNGLTALNILNGNTLKGNDEHLIVYYPNSVSKDYVTTCSASLNGSSSSNSGKAYISAGDITFNNQLTLNFNENSQDASDSDVYNSSNVPSLSLNACADGETEYTNYYLFLEATGVMDYSQSFLNDGHVLSEGGTQGATYSDTLVFKSIYGDNFTVSELDTSGAAVAITSTGTNTYQASWFYQHYYETMDRGVSRLKSSIENGSYDFTGFYTSSGNNFYIVPYQYTNADGNTFYTFSNTTSVDQGGNFSYYWSVNSNSSGYISSSVSATAALGSGSYVNKVTLSDYSGFTFSIYRRVLAKSAFSGGTLGTYLSFENQTNGNVYYYVYQPIVYVMKFCKKETTCEDTIQGATCETEEDVGTTIVFHESNELSACIVDESEINSGFVIKSSNITVSESTTANNSNESSGGTQVYKFTSAASSYNYQLASYTSKTPTKGLTFSSSGTSSYSADIKPSSNNSNNNYITSTSYGTVACKDDFDIYLPTTKYAYAGNYFTLDHYTPQIKAVRTCITTQISYDQFENDLTDALNDLSYKYKIYQDLSYIYNNLDGEYTSSSSITCCTSHTCGEYGNECCESSCNRRYWEIYSIDKTQTPNGILSYSGASGSYKDGSQGSCTGGTTLNEALSNLKTQYYSLLTQADDAVDQAKYVVLNLINAYKNMYTWVSQYQFDFEPTVTFTYEDKDNVIANTGQYTYTYKYTEESAKVEATYTPSGASINNISYTDEGNISLDGIVIDGSTGVLLTGTNSELGTLLGGSPTQVDTTTNYNSLLSSLSTKTFSASNSCYTLNSSGELVLDSTCSSTFTVKVYDNAYVIRKETINYLNGDLKLPTVYSSIPSGKVSTSTSSSSSYLQLEDNAVPININTVAGEYDYTISITNMSDTVRDNAVVKETLESRFTSFNASSGGSAFVDNTYTCHYVVVNDIYDPDPDGDGNDDGNGTLGYFYRVIDMSDINPNTRTLGYNWTSTAAEKVIERMKSADSNYQILTGNSNIE